MKTGFAFLNVLCLGVLFTIAATSPAFAKHGASHTLSSSSGVMNWAGFYAGGHLGATGGSFNNQPGVIGPTGESGDVSGGFLGGYNWQHGAWVFGGEADWSHIDVSGRSATSAFEENWMMSFRGRLGYVVDEFMPFVTVGLGITETTAKITAGSLESSSVETGVTAGAGVETFVSNNWFGRAEYLYTEVPQSTKTLGASTVTGGSDNHTGRVVIGYRF